MGGVLSREEGPGRGVPGPSSCQGYCKNRSAPAAFTVECRIYRKLGSKRRYFQQLVAPALHASNCVGILRGVTRRSVSLRSRPLTRHVPGQLLAAGDVFRCAGRQRFAFCGGIDSGHCDLVSAVGPGVAAQIRQPARARPAVSATPQTIRRAIRLLTPSAAAAILAARAAGSRSTVQE